MNRFPPRSQPTREPGALLSRTRSGVALRFAGGAAMGALIVAAPVAAGHPLPFSSLEVGVAALVVATSGVMGCLWGARFLDAVSRALNSTSV